MVRQSRKLKVFITGGDEQGWALDTDLRLTRDALKDTVELVDNLGDADIIHTVWPEQLLEDPRFEPVLNSGKPIVAMFSNDPLVLFERVPGLFEAAKKWYCVGQSKSAVEKLKSVEVPFVRYVPYCVDLGTFKSIDPSNSGLKSLKAELGLKDEHYVIGSFQRDSQGGALDQIKPQKGADIFLSILVGLKNRIGHDAFEKKVRVLLAGPRRHWLRKRFEEYKIPYVFDGKLTSNDDYPKNILPAERIATLTNLVDLYVISSRWEGGPRAVLETIACKRKVISTNVGIVSDVMEKECIFENLSQAINLLQEDIEKSSLDQFVPKHFDNLEKTSSPRAVKEAWAGFYDEFNNLDTTKKLISENTERKSKKNVKISKRYRLKLYSLLSKIQQKLPHKNKKTINIWGEMISGPYGGGSQFLKALGRELEDRGYAVVNNSMREVDAHILNSAWFDVDRCRYAILNAQNKPKVLHRIDGPIYLYRGSDKTNDDAIFKLNQDVATGTAFQGVYSWKASLDAGYKPINPFIIRNASDPNLFFKKKEPWDGKRKLKIVSTSWSTNKLKGFDTYKYLDEHLDFSKYDYEFVGRTPVEFKNIKHIDAVASKKLGEHLRGADLFITASLYDPASNSLTEAITTGLPVIYAKSGGHSEVTWYSGMGFSKAEEIPAMIEQIAKDYESYRLCTYAMNIKDVVDQYLKALELK